jgi:hypothetical protein
MEQELGLAFEWEQRLPEQLVAIPDLRLPRASRMLEAVLVLEGDDAD